MAACKRCGVAYGLGSSTRGVAPVEFCANCEAAESRAAIWHVAVGEVAHGPYTRAELLSFRTSDRLAANGFVHREGWPDWRRCAEVDELRESVSALPPVPGASSLPALPARGLEVASGDCIEPGSALDAGFAQTSQQPVAAAFQAMGHDPFADSELDSGDDEVTRHGQIPHPGFAGVTGKSWDLDHVPALAALSASGRGVVVPHTGNAEGDRSGVIDMASMIQSSGRALQDPTMRSVVGGSSSGQRPAQRRLARTQLERVRPSVLVGLGMAGLLLGTGSILAWSAVRSSGKTSPELRAQANAAVADAARLASASPAAAQATPEPVAKPPAAAPIAASANAAVAALEPAARDASPEIVIDEATANAHEVASGDDGAARDRAARAKAARVSRWQARHAARLAAKARRASRWAAKHAAASDAFASAPKHAASRPDDAEPEATSKATNKPASKATSKDESLDDLVAGALSSKHPPAKLAAPPKSDESDLPATPSRDEMLAALSKAKSLVAKCKGSGMATVSINLKGPAGRASRVSVEGVDGSARSCVESAIKKTPFPKFQQETFAVKVPFKLQET